MSQRLLTNFLYSNSYKNRMIYIECMKNIIQTCHPEIIKKFVFLYLMNLCKDEIVNVILRLLDILPLL